MAALWESLPVSEDDDQEVERRLKELASDPTSEISHEEFLESVVKNRSRER